MSRLRRQRNTLLRSLSHASRFRVLRVLCEPSADLAVARIRKGTGFPVIQQTAFLFLRILRILYSCGLIHEHSLTYLCLFLLKTEWKKP